MLWNIYQMKLETCWIYGTWTWVIITSLPKCHTVSFQKSLKKSSNSPFFKLFWFKRGETVSSRDYTCKLILTIRTRGHLLSVFWNNLIWPYFEIWMIIKITFSFILQTFFLRNSSHWTYRTPLWYSFPRIISKLTMLWRIFFWTITLHQVPFHFLHKHLTVW